MLYMLILNEDRELVSSDAAVEDLVRRTGAFARALHEKGALKGGQRLSPDTPARRIRTRGGKQLVMDGPFIESKEVIGGFFIVEAASMDEAVQIAAGCPNAEFGSVEVHEIQLMG